MPDPSRKPGGRGWVITCPGKGHSLVLSLSILASFISLHLLPQPGARKLKFSLSRCKRKSPWPRGLLTVQAAMQRSFYWKRCLDQTDKTAHCCDPMRVAVPGGEHRRWRRLEGQALLSLLTYKFIKLTASQCRSVRPERVAFDHRERLLLFPLSGPPPTPPPR